MGFQIQLFRAVRFGFFIFLIPFMAQAGAKSPTKDTTEKDGNVSATAAADFAGPSPAPQTRPDLSRIQSLQRIGRAALTRKHLSELRTLPAKIEGFRSEIRIERAKEASLTDADRESAMVQIQTEAGKQLDLLQEAVTGIKQKEPIQLASETCAICLESFSFGQTVQKLKCGCKLFYHDSCFNQWESRTCTGCGKRWGVDEVTLRTTLRLEGQLKEIEARYAHAKAALRQYESTDNENLGGIAGLNAVPMPARTFIMGSPANEVGRFGDERQHPVKVQAFKPMDTHLTRAQYREIMGRNPNLASCHGITQQEIRDWDLEANRNKPVTCISWNNTQEVLTRLAARGVRARRITDEEAEYLMRLSEGQVISTTAYPWGNAPDQLDEYAWHGGNSENHVHAVKTRRPIERIYDARGNVCTWTENPYPAGFNRILRGGDWSGTPQLLRSAFRSGGRPEYRYPYVGVRLVFE